VVIRQSHRAAQRIQVLCVFHRLSNQAQRKKKEPKKKERGGPWKLPQVRKSIKDASQYFLDDFHNCLENPAGFPTATTGPAAVKLTHDDNH
jgi:hypothetical protein